MQLTTRRSPRNILGNLIFFIVTIVVFGTEPVAVSLPQYIWCEVALQQTHQKEGKLIEGHVVGFYRE